MSAQMRDKKAVLRTRGSSAALWIWKIVRMALPRSVSVSFDGRHSHDDAHERRRAETTFNVFHSLSKESMNASHECLNRASAGDTAGGFQSSGKGRNAMCGLGLRAAPGLRLALWPSGAPSPFRPSVETKHTSIIL